MPSERPSRTLDEEYLERARRDALRRDYRLLTPGQRVEQAAALSAEMTKLAARRTERAHGDQVVVAAKGSSGAS